MSGSGRTDPARPVRAGGGDRAAYFCQQIPRRRRPRDPQGDTVETGAGQPGDRTCGRPFQNQRQRPRPEGLRNNFRTRVGLAQGEGGFGRWHMTDQRVESGSALDIEDPSDGGLVGCVRAQPVDRLCRKRDELALSQQIGGLAAGT